MDLGSSKNQLLSRRSGGGRRVALSAVGLLVVVAAVIWVTGEDEPEGPDDEAVALTEADQFVASAARASQTIVDEKRREAEEREAELQRAREVDWEQGMSALLIEEVEPDQSVYVSMVQRGIPEGSVHRVVTATEEEFNFRNSRAGDEWRAEVDEQGRVEKFQYEKSPEDIWVTRFDDEKGEYVADKKEVDVDVGQRRVAGEVEGSFWLSISGAGESDLLAHRFMEVFRYTIDFNTESRDGDRYAMVIEELYLDGEFLRYGRVLAATYIGQRGTRQAYYYEADDGEESGYFDEEGESLERRFLRSPLEVTRVTSTFGRREHPITGDQRMHRGVDYGAPTGTPVQAVADGTVTFAGWRGGYGNLLEIRHTGGYKTRYAHLSSFSSGVTAGARVSQGQIVARSGNTGASTAPHLHYEMMRNGRHIDPLEVDTSSGEPLEEEHREQFVAEVVGPLSSELHEAMAGDAPEELEVVAEGEAEIDEDDE